MGHRSRALLSAHKEGVEQHQEPALLAVRRGRAERVRMVEQVASAVQRPSPEAAEAALLVRAVLAATAAPATTPHQAMTLVEAADQERVHRRQAELVEPARLHQLLVAPMPTAAVPAAQVVAEPVLHQQPLPECGLQILAALVLQLAAEAAEPDRHRVTLATVQTTVEAEAVRATATVVPVRKALLLLPMFRA
jgi:hypothetical protein